MPENIDMYVRKAMSPERAVVAVSGMTTKDTPGVAGRPSIADREVGA